MAEGTMAFHHAPSAIGFGLWSMDYESSCGGLWELLQPAHLYFLLQEFELGVSGDKFGFFLPG